MPRPIVEPASKPQAEYHDWDARYPRVVASLLANIDSLPPFLKIEHVGSTAVPGCGGKRIIDLLALYRNGHFTAAKGYLLSLGFGPQGSEFTRPWPPERPMLLGNFRWNGHPFLIYVHVINEDSDEVRRFRDFRDRLMHNPALVDEYCATKRRIIATGTADTDDYAVQKRPAIHTILGDAYHLTRAAHRTGSDNAG